MAVNSLIYLNQSVPPYGVSLNSIASYTTNFPLSKYSNIYFCTIIIDNIHNFLVTNLALTS